MPASSLQRPQRLGTLPRTYPQHSIWLRVGLAMVSCVLLGHSLFLLLWRHFHLGVLLPAMLGVAGIVLATYWPQVVAWKAASLWRQRLWQWVWWGFALWLLSLLLFWHWLAGAGLSPQQVPPVKAIVVLGSGTQNGEPRPTLAARLDAAAALAQLQPDAFIAVCGGVDWGETESEAQVMARYLAVRHGISPERIVQEKESTSTELNLQLSRPLLQARGVQANDPVALVSSDFHLRRALAIAHQQGLHHMLPVAAPTPLSSRYNAWLREYFAMFSSLVLGEFDWRSTVWGMRTPHVQNMNQNQS